LIDIHKDIIEACKRGERASQYKLYQLYSKAMFSVSNRLLNNREWAQDVLQEAFVDAFQKLNSYRYEAPFGSWLKRIVINKSLNELTRRRAKVMLYEDMQSFDQVDITEQIDEEALALSVDKIKQAVAKLSDGFRIVFSLYMFEGYDHEEIADILHISESTSKTQLMRAKIKVKEQLKTI